MFIRRLIEGYLINWGGYHNDGKFYPSDVTTSTVRITLDDIHSVFAQFEAIGEDATEQVSIKVGRFTYDLEYDQARELLSIVSQIQFDEEPLPIKHSWPEEFWTEDYLLNL